jgi:hypothetical protein
MDWMDWTCGNFQYPDVLKLRTKPNSKLNHHIENYHEDVTHLLLEEVNDLQRIFINNPGFWSTFLCLLDMIYYVDRQNIQIARPESPKPNEIIAFFQSHWPEIRLTDLSSCQLQSNDSELGNSDLQAGRRHIPLNYPLVTCWLQMAPIILRLL